MRLFFICLPLGPELKRLVDAQRFEDAAAVRDRLRQLKGFMPTVTPVASSPGPIFCLLFHLARFFSRMRTNNNHIVMRVIIFLRNQEYVQL